ncbi:BLUF domain-containing protein [Burkholderia sp. WSM2232]|uniref:BLUF domain-containing protein n=1 Tax=Burkholderia sp. WSM2232 TaxID=944436 RepID=UPI000489DADB|nr:BLUF domain-containing protein [Burkholderia sp. WSM2232]
MCSDESGRPGPPSDDETLFAAVYISNVCAGVGIADVESIVSVSRVLNRADALTGFLVHAGRNFVQYLEGNPGAVRECLRRIGNDRRHHEMRIVAIGSLERRRFVEWSMGYFTGDLDGSERIESILTSWSGTDRSLLEEVWRICQAARTLPEVSESHLVAGRFDVLLRRDAQSSV